MTNFDRGVQMNLENSALWMLMVIQETYLYNKKLQKS